MLGIDGRAARYTFTSALVLLLLYAVFMVRGTLFVLAVSILLAYLLYPLVDYLNGHLPSRSQAPALAIVYLVLIGGVIALGITIGSRAADDAATLSQRAPELIERMKAATHSGPGGCPINPRHRPEHNSVLRLQTLQ